MSIILLLKVFFLKIAKILLGKFYLGKETLEIFELFIVNILYTVSLWYLPDWEQDFLQINKTPASESTWILLDMDTVKINEIKVLIFNYW